jgi:small subunit ribosomal protein S16
MLKIKLTRIGKKGQPQYRIVVMEARTKNGNKNVAEIGYYNPGYNPAQVKLDQAAYQAWLEKGAQPTPTVRGLATPTKSTKK